MQLKYHQEALSLQFILTLGAENDSSAAQKKIIQMEENTTPEVEIQLWHIHKHTQYNAYMCIKYIYLKYNRTTLGSMGKMSIPE